MSKPVLLMHPRLLAVERLLDAYEIVHIPEEEPARTAFIKDVAPRIDAATAIGSKGLPNDVIEASPKLKLIAAFGAGYDAIDLPLLHKRGVTLTNCPNVNSEDVADVGIALMLSILRQIAEGDRMVRAGTWQGTLALPPSRRLRGRKVGVIGFGAIGKAFADRAAAFGMEVSWTGPRAKAGTPYPFIADLLALAKQSDVLAICCRADPGTEKMINADVLKALGADGVLINIARGSIVDEDALIAALKSGGLSGAGLDVFEEEPTPAPRWKDVPNVSLTPHLAGGTRESLRDTTMMVVENLRRHFAGEPLLSPVG